MALTYYAVLPAYLIPCPPRKAFNRLQGMDRMGSLTFSKLHLYCLLVAGDGHGNRDELCRADCIPADPKPVLSQLVSVGPLLGGQMSGTYAISQTKGLAYPSVSEHLNIASA